MRPSASLASLAAVSCGVAVIVAACSSPTPDSNFGASSGSSGSSGASSSGASGNSSFGGSTSSGGEDSGADSGSCFAPVDMYIVFDKSGSMGEPAGNGAAGDCKIGDTKNSKWCHAINALAGYLSSADAKDQSAALQFFSGNDNFSCSTGAPYDQPAVPTSSYTTLPSTSFNSALDNASPDDATPMEAALRGLTKYTAANRRPGHVTIGILVTDGNPQGCSTNLGTLSSILADHFAATKIRTYVIGMNGATFSNLEKLGVGGGGPTHDATVGKLTGACGTGGGSVPAPCHFWNVGDGDPAGFIQALAAIQESADGCKPGGGSVNPPN